MYCANTPLLGTGCTSESTQRTAMRSAAGVRSVVVTVIVVSLDREVWLSLCADAGPDVYAIQLGGVSPAQLVALLGGVGGGDLQLVELPMRVARPEHHHVLLAGEPEPLAGEFGITGPVHGALHEVGVPGQVVTRHLRRPRRLFEVGTAETVHPPDERCQQVGGSVRPHELQRRHSFEYPLSDHVHQVVQVIQRHEADVLLIGARNPRRSRRERYTGADLD